MMVSSDYPQMTSFQLSDHSDDLARMIKSDGFIYIVWIFRIWQAIIWSFHIPFGNDCYIANWKITMFIGQIHSLNGDFP